jgi:hypothetical protein
MGFQQLILRGQKPHVRFQQLIRRGQKPHVRFQKLIRRGQKPSNIYPTHPSRSFLCHAQHRQDGHRFLCNQDIMALRVIT